jgi:hypothetical protein
MFLLDPVSEVTKENTERMVQGRLGIGSYSKIFLLINQPQLTPSVFHQPFTQVFKGGVFKGDVAGLPQGHMHAPHSVCQPQVSPRWWGFVWTEGSTDIAVQRASCFPCVHLQSSGPGCPVFLFSPRL